MLSYYQQYLKKNKKRVSKISKALDKKYNKYKTLSNTLYPKQFGGSPKFDVLDKFMKKASSIEDTLNKLEGFSPILKDYKDKISALIEVIDAVYSAGGDHVSGGLDSIKLEKMMNKLDEINVIVRSILNKDTIRMHNDQDIHGDIFAKPEKDSWEDILIIYRIMIEDFNKLQTQAKSMDLHEIYTHIAINISKNIGSLKSLEVLIDEYEMELRSKISVLLDNMNTDFKLSDLAFSTESIYRYTLRIEFGSDIQKPIGADYTILKNTTDNLINYYYNSSLINIPIDVNKAEYNSIVDAKDALRKTLQIGGKINTANHLKETQGIGEIKNSLMDLSIKYEQLNIKMGTVHELRNGFEQYRIRYSYYLMYVIMIMTKKQMLKEQIIYKYVNKGTIQFYYSIIKNIMNKIENSDKTDIIKFFSTYHYFTLLKTKNLCKFIIGHTQTEQVIDIFKSSPELITDFTLLNNFKDILESYHEIFQNKVSMYSRINDWTEETLSLNNSTKLFLSYENDATQMIVNPQPCDIDDKVYNVTFNEVFDSINFKRNSIISKYMSLETQISKGKGIMMITYGYSGVGKTVTLFGNDKIEGMLQSTLSNIRDMENVYIRIYEMYGIGIQYSDYWDKGQIAQEIFDYRLHIKNGSFEIATVDKTRDISGYVALDNYFMVEKDFTEKVFKNFGGLIDKLDKIRKDEKRITLTPNNPDSSRSIIVYDIMIGVKGKRVPFIIIDLPGREEIIQTYVKTYLEKPFVSQANLDTPFHRTLLASLALNPLAAALLIPSIIFETMNDLDYELREEILMTPVEDETGAVVTLVDEYLSQKMNKARQVTGTFYIKDILSFGRNWTSSYKDKTNKYKFTMIDNINYSNTLGSYQRVVQINTLSSINNKHQHDKEVNSIQYQAIGAMHVMNRIIKMNRFNVLAKIAKRAINEYINAPLKAFISTLDTVKAKRDFLKEYLTLSSVDQLTKNDLDSAVNNMILYQNFLTPFEGIYINENIIGLIKYLAKDILGKTDEDIQREIAPLQSNKLGFSTQKHEIRNWNYNLYPTQLTYDNELAGKKHVRKFQGTYDPVLYDIVQFENIDRDNEVLREMFHKIKASYSSEGIYNYDKPSIGNILEHYKTVSGNTVPIDDYKIFYLFSNEMINLKCKHQLKLLENTRSFIKAIED